MHIYIYTDYIDMRYKKHNMLFSRHLVFKPATKPHIPQMFHLSTPSTQKIGDLGVGDLWTP